MSRRAKPVVMPLDVSAWLCSDEVQSLSLAGQGAYLRLLAFAWLHDGLPADEVSLRGLLGLTYDGAPFQAIWSVLSRFWAPGADGRLRNARQERERAELAERSASRAAAGQAGGQRSAEQRGSKVEANLQQDAKQATKQEGSRAGSKVEANLQQAPSVLPVQPQAEPEPEPEEGWKEGSLSGYQKGQGGVVSTLGPRAAGSIAGDVLRALRHG